MSSPLIRIKAPAKINLTLAILGKRPDGFHELESWVVRIDLHDVLDFSESGDWSLHVNTCDPAVTNDDQNLVSRAAAALARHANRPCHARVALTKFIPSGAGLGGGSSDAAATLRGLNQLWQLHWPDERLAEIGAEVGSDIPFFLGPPSSIMRGRGERIEGVAFDWRGWIGLVIPPFKLATAEVYKRFKLNERKPQIEACEIPAMQSRGTSRWGSLLFNDLEAPAFGIEPRLDRLRREAAGGTPLRMTGSGSCLFSLFDTESEAEYWRTIVHGSCEESVWVFLAKTA